MLEQQLFNFDDRGIRMASIKSGKAHYVSGDYGLSCPALRLYGWGNVDSVIRCHPPRRLNGVSCEQYIN